MYCTCCRNDNKTLTFLKYRRCRFLRNESVYDRACFFCKRYETVHFWCLFLLVLHHLVKEQTAAEPFNPPPSVCQVAGAETVISRISLSTANQVGGEVEDARALQKKKKTTTFLYLTNLLVTKVSGAGTFIKQSDNSDSYQGQIRLWWR